MVECRFVAMNGYDVVDRLEFRHLFMRRSNQLRIDKLQGGSGTPISLGTRLTQRPRFSVSPFNHATDLTTPRTPPHHHSLLRASPFIEICG